MNVVSVSVTERGRALAEHLPFAHQHGDAATAVAAHWRTADGLVLFLATGAAVRLIAPLLEDKARDPAVVCVDESGRFAVALVGGHRCGGGANELAQRVAALLGAQAVVTTATDAIGLIALDQLPGFRATGDIAGVTTARLDGRGVRVDNPRQWPVPLTHDPAGTVIVRVTDSVRAPERGVAAIHPPSLVAGIGTSSGAPAEEVAALLRAALAVAELAPQSVAEVATIDRRAAEPAVVALGYPVRAFTAPELAAVEVPNPSPRVEAAVGTPSVCEAAALLAAGPGGELVVAKQTSATATVAVARRLRPRGHLSIVGLGPGDARHRTPAAEAAVRRAQVVIGYHGYLEQCRDLLHPGQQVVGSPIGDEGVRAKQALAEASDGRRVALVCSGDAGVYGMASPVLEQADGTVDIDVVPGVTAALAAAALAGAPLGHDFVSVSLSDLLTSWEVIASRLEAAAGADLVVVLYNPRSARRTWQLDAARTILLRRRPPDTPVAVVTAAGRRGQSIALSTLAGFDATAVGMASCVIIGAGSTTVTHGRMVTPRGYR